MIHNTNLSALTSITIHPSVPLQDVVKKLFETACVGNVIRIPNKINYPSHPHPNKQQKEPQRPVTGTAALVYFSSRS